MSTFGAPDGVASVNATPRSASAAATWAVLAMLSTPSSAARASAYALATPREQPAIAAANPTKLEAMNALVARHQGERILVMGTYLEPLRAAARPLQRPLLPRRPHLQRGHGVRSSPCPSCE
mgnify:CR=1 FL=1